MKKEEAPQDNISMYKGERKALYASGDTGEFEITQSSGWSVEEIATLQAVEEFERLESEAFRDFKECKTSPLAVWMYRRRMSLATLSQCAGLWKWQVKRHMRADIFNSLNVKKITLYCDILNVMPEELHNPKEMK